jgi:superfamily II DNA or RNA helicase
MRSGVTRKLYARLKAEATQPEADYECTITILGNVARIDGTFPTSVVQGVTSYYSPGYQFTMQYRAKVWDGKVKLYRRATRTFPAGLVPDVAGALREFGAKVTVDDQRQCPGHLCERVTDVCLEGLSFDPPFEYQPQCAEAMIQAQRGIAAVATNGGKTVIAALVTKALRLPMLFVVPSRDLLHQSRKVFMQRLGLNADGVGVCGDGVWQPGKWITVATVDTLHSKLATPKGQTLLNGIDLLFVDECHHVGADTWYEVISQCPAFYRFGLSGTPLKRSDGGDMKLIGATGSIVYEIRNKELIRRGISVQPHISWIKVTQPLLAKGIKYPEAYRLGIVENVWRNTAVARAAAERVERGLNVLILVSELKHGRILDEKLWNYSPGAFVPHQFISGEEPTEVRTKAFEDFRRGDLRVLIATSIMNEGIDMPNIDALVLAAGGKSSIRTLQRVGRGLRKGGNVDRLEVVDFADFQSKYLVDHSLQRLMDYRAEDCFVVDSIK